jgi:branched-chain amino acid transport system substrate-binding protein
MLICGVLYYLTSSLWAIQGVTPNEIRIGTHTAMSGPAATWGLGAVRALRFHFAEINAAGGIHGRQMRLIAEDHQYQVVRARQAANKLVLHDQVFIMLAALGTSMNQVALPLQEEHDVANLFPYTSARLMSEPFHPLKFTASVSYFDQAQALVRYFHQRQLQHFCLMHQNTDYGREMLDGVEAGLQGFGMSLTAVETHSPTETNFLNTLLRLKEANCEVVLLGTILGDTIRILQTRQSLQWDVLMGGNVSAYDQIVIDRAGTAAEGFLATASIEMLYAERLTSSAAQDFFTKYQTEYGEFPNNAVQMAYFYARILTHALQLAGPELNSEKLIRALESMNNYQDELGGPILQFGPNDHEGVEKPLLAEVQQGHWRTVQSVMN